MIQQCTYFIAAFVSDVVVVREINALALHLSAMTMELAYMYLLRSRDDAGTGQVHRVDHPNVFELQCGHAVDDNNNIRSRAGDLALAWKSTTHMMACRATGDANALKYWNYLHPTSQLTKAAWRKALVPELLTSAQHATAYKMRLRG